MNLPVKTMLLKFPLISLFALSICVFANQPGTSAAVTPSIKNTKNSGQTPAVSFNDNDYRLSKLTIEEKIGQLLMPRLRWQIKGVDSSTVDLMKTVPVGGIALYRDNVENIPQLQAFTKDLQALARLPLFIAIDEEGGRVSRIGRLFSGPTPPAYDIGSRGDFTAAYAAACTIGRRLTHLGINMNFAPIADIWSNPANKAIGNRAFGKTPDITAEMVAVTVRGFASQGVLAVVKHFPGHGDTYEDSHYHPAVYPHKREHFNKVEAIPFVKAIEAGTAGIMTGHIVTPAFKESRLLMSWKAPFVKAGALPVTFSDFWLQDVLRKDMGFDGLIISDALDMRALTDHFTSEQIILGTFLAGADILLVPPNPKEAFKIMIDAYNTGLFDEERVNRSVRRVLKAKERWLIRE